MQAKAPRKDVLTEPTPEEMRDLKHIHNNIGHPSNRTFSRILKHAKCKAGISEHGVSSATRPSDDDAFKGVEGQRGRRCRGGGTWARVDKSKGHNQYVGYCCCCARARGSFLERA